MAVVSASVMGDSADDPIFDPLERLLHSSLETEEERNLVERLFAIARAEFAPNLVDVHRGFGRYAEETAWLRTDINHRKASGDDIHPSEEVDGVLLVLRHKLAWVVFTMFFARKRIIEALLNGAADEEKAAFALRFQCALPVSGANTTASPVASFLSGYYNGCVTIMHALRNFAITWTALRPPEMLRLWASRQHTM